MGARVVRCECVCVWLCVCVCFAIINHKNGNSSGAITGTRTDLIESIERVLAVYVNFYLWVFMLLYFCFLCVVICRIVWWWSPMPNRIAHIWTHSVIQHNHQRALLRSPALPQNANKANATNCIVNICVKRSNPTE